MNTPPVTQYSRSVATQRPFPVSYPPRTYKEVVTMNGKKRIPYAHVLYAAALTALLSACAQSDCVPAAAAGSVANATPAAVAAATDMPEIVITAARELPEVVVTASREIPDVAG
jgi:hypothetical protein